MAPRTTPPFRADHVGSLLRPAELHAARADRAAGRITAEELRAVEDEAIRDAVALQQLVGLRSVTDGEFRRATWHMDFIYQIGGIDRAPGTLLSTFHNEEGDITFTPDAIQVTRRLSVDETIQTVDALRERFPALLDPPSDDICYATQNRQAAVKAIAAQADLVIVVGSPNSSNSVRLVEVARDYGTPAAYLVDDAGEVDERWLDGVTTIGVTSGASVPEELVTAVLDKLAGHGFGDVEEVEAVKERMVFQLPRELRK